MWNHFWQCYSKVHPTTPFSLVEVLFHPSKPYKSQCFPPKKHVPHFWRSFQMRQTHCCSLKTPGQWPRVLIQYAVFDFTTTYFELSIESFMNLKNNVKFGTRWGPTIYTWDYNPYKWVYKSVTEVITPLIGVIILFKPNRGSP